MRREWDRDDLTACWTLVDGDRPLVGNKSIAWKGVLLWEATFPAISVVSPCCTRRREPTRARTGSGCR